MEPEQVRVVRVRIRNYRGCRDTVFYPNGGLSTLIGKNAAGKTTILHGLQLLGRIASGEYRYSRTARVTHNCSIEATFSLNLGFPLEVSLRVLIGYSLDDRNQDEIEASRLFVRVPRNRRKDQWAPLPPVVLAAGRSRELRSHVHAAFDQLPASLQVSGGIHFELPPFKLPKYEEQLPFVWIVAKFLSQIKYYGASQFSTPELCPASIEIEDDRLRGTGMRAGGHQRFLHDLFLADSRDDNSYKQFREIVGKNALGLVHRITFKQFRFPTNQYEVKSGGRILRQRGYRQLVIPFFHLGNLRLSPNQLSEGTLKTIALVFYITTSSSPILLIEEPEVGVHHGLLRSIVEIIKDFSKEKQIIVTTHSDFILDALQPDDVFLVRADSVRGVKVGALSKSLSAMNFSALRDFLRDSGGLGEYVRSGGLHDDA